MHVCFRQKLAEKNARETKRKTHAETILLLFYYYKKARHYVEISCLMYYASINARVRSWFI